MVLRYQDGLGRTTQTLDHVVVVHILIWDKRKSPINEYSEHSTIWELWMIMCSDGWKTVPGGGATKQGTKEWNQQQHPANKPHAWPKPCTWSLPLFLVPLLSRPGTWPTCLATLSLLSLSLSPLSRPSRGSLLSLSLPLLTLLSLLCLLPLLLSLLCPLSRPSRGLSPLSRPSGLLFPVAESGERARTSLSGRQAQPRGLVCV